MQNMPIAIFRGDDTDALGYQTIVGTIRTDLNLTGCKAVFKYLSFSVEFDPIPEDKKLTVIIPASETSKFPPGLGYASLRVYDSEGKLCTFSNRIMVFVATKTPMFGNEEFEVDFNVRPELEPLKIFVGPNPDDFDEYRGFLEKVIDRASAEKYGLAILLDAIDSDLGANDGVAATPVAVKAAYAAVIGKLTDEYYTKDETNEAIDRVAAYYITYDAVGHAFPTHSDLVNAQTYYSGGKARTPTRNDYAIVLADETHDNAEYRYIYAVAEGETTGSWQPQYPVEGVMTVDQSVTKNSQNPVASSGIWSAIWGALSALPTGFSSLYDWCVSQLSGKASTADATLNAASYKYSAWDMSAFPATFQSSQPQTYHNEVTDKYEWVILTGGVVVSDEKYDTEADALLALSITMRGPQLPDGAVATRTATPTSYRLGPYDGLNPNARLQPAGDYYEKPSGGIPKSDLASAVQSSLNAADAALPATNVVAPSTSVSDSGKAADAKATGDALAGKLDKSGDTMTGNLVIQAADAFLKIVNSGESQNPYIQIFKDAIRLGSDGGYITINLPTQGGRLALVEQLNDKLNSSSAAPAFQVYNTYAVGDHCTYNGALYRCTTAITTPGAAWDASKWTADMASNYFQYALTTKTIDNGAVSLDDRASNAVTISATLSPNTLTINFPTAPTGKLRDFAMRLNIAAGVTAPEIAWPQGVTLENDGGEVPEIADGGTGGSSTILYFSETENNGTTAKFLVKGETLTAIAQA